MQSNHRGQQVPPSIECTVCTMQKADKSLQCKKNNWETWSQSIYMLFDLAELTPYVEGMLSCPDSVIDLVGARNWRYNDTFTKIMISNNIAPSECPHTCGCATAHKIYHHLSQENIIVLDKFFKHLLAGLLLRSWDNFTQAYLHGSLDEVKLDPKRRTDSQQFIGICKQEYEL